MPNPFDWRGPEFLLFYVGLGIVVTLAIALLRHRLEPAVATAAPLSDYLKIAYLRGGPDEALRVATVSLIDRGLVELVDNDHVKTASATLPLACSARNSACSRPARTRRARASSTTRAQIIVRTECEVSWFVRGCCRPDDQAGRQWLLLMGLLVLGLVAFVRS